MYTVVIVEVVRARYNHKKTTNSGQKKKVFGAFILVFIFIFGIGGYTFAATSKDLSEITPVLNQPDETVPKNIEITWPSAGQAAIGSMDEGLIATSINQKQQPIASITKIITALAVLKKAPLELGETGKVYTLDSSDVKIYRDYVAVGGSVMPVSAGMKMTEYDALNAMLLPSANNIADSLVRLNFESKEIYLNYANEMIRSYGLSSTVVADASGFSSGSVSTPSELITVARRALENDVIAQIVKKQKYTIPGVGVIRNTNYLLTTNPNAIGLKTGTTDEAGYCLLFAEDYKISDNKTIKIIGVLLGANSAGKLFSDVNSLIASVEPGFGDTVIAKKDTIVGSYITDWGTKTEAVLAEDLVVSGWRGTDRKLNIELIKITPPTSAGTIVGIANVEGSDYTENVILYSPILEPSLTWKLQNVF